MFLDGDVQNCHCFCKEFGANLGKFRLSRACALSYGIRASNGEGMSGKELFGAKKEIIPKLPSYRRAIANLRITQADIFLERGNIAIIAGENED